LPILVVEDCSNKAELVAQAVVTLNILIT